MPEPRYMDPDFKGFESKRCGRIDESHPRGHTWKMPQVAGRRLKAKTYWCPGTPVMEGGQVHGKGFEDDRPRASS